VSAPHIGLVGAVRVVGAVARRPRLWPTAVRQMRRTARPRWWRHRPFLPLPAGEYLHFRLVTQYGETRDPPAPHDVVDYLAWCREWERSLG
jgi:hypothetical protein